VQVVPTPSWVEAVSLMKYGAVETRSPPQPAVASFAPHGGGGAALAPRGRQIAVAKIPAAGPVQSGS
jgi:hypothetical protein